MNNYLNTATTAARKAGKKLIEIKDTQLTLQKKSKHDVLLEADLAAEKIILDEINSNFPDHSIFSEEEGEIIKDSEYQWIIDPLDGSINYSNGLDEYGVSIALLKNEEAILGVIYIPETNELYSAEKGKGAFLDEREISISPDKDMEDLVGSVDMTSKISHRLQLFDIMKTLAPEVRGMRIYGATSFDLAKTAAGKLDFYIKNRFNYWDIAAGKLIIEEAGGVVTNFKNEPIGKESDTFIAANKKVQQELSALLLNS